MLQLVRNYYYHPVMGGSNSIKAVLPAVMHGVSIKEKYSKPLAFGTHLKGQVLYVWDNTDKKPKSPYQLLPPIDGKTDAIVKEGGSALVAYAKMQFSDMPAAERATLRKALLQYCELDTLAMVMIYEQWSHHFKGNG